MSKKITYSLPKTLKKVLKIVLFVAIPVIATEFPEVMDLTIGCILYGLHDWLKHDKGIKLPFIG